MGLTQKLGTIPLAIFTDASNNIGIGGSPSGSYKLDVNGNSKVLNNLTISSTTNAALIAATNSTTGYTYIDIINNGASGRNYQIGLGGNAAAAGYANNLYFDLVGVGNIMTLTSGRNVGIGTTSPTARLTIYGGELKWGFTSDFGALSYTNGMPMLASVGALDFLFYTNAAERMRITSGGQIQVKQASNSFTGGFGTINLSGNIWSILAGGDNNFYIGFNFGALGYFSSSTGNYVALSDINKKKDFEQSTIGLNAIMGLKPTLYRMASEDDSAEKHLGFIAQEVKEFIPQAYSETGDFIGLEDRPIIAALVKAVQELSAKVSALENKS